MSYKQTRIPRLRLNKLRPVKPVRLVPLLLVGIIAWSAISAITGQVAYASHDYNSNLGAHEEAQIYATANAVAYCMREETRSGRLVHGFNNNLIDDSRARSGDWFDTSAQHWTFIGDGPQTAPSWLFGMSDEGGWEHCNDAVKRAYPMFGYSDALEMLCDMGAQRQNNQGCTTGTSNFGVSGVSGLHNTFRQKVADRMYGGDVSNLTHASGAAFYVLNERVFDQYCLRGMDGRGRATQENPNAQSPFRYTVSVVTADGTLRQNVVYEGRDTGDRTHTYTVNDRQRPNCATIAENVSRFAANYAQWREDNPDANIPGAVEPEQTCETETGDVFSVLVVCPLNSLVQDLIRNVDGWINQLLHVNTSQIFGGTGITPDERASSNAFRSAWSSFRTIALGLVIIAALIVIVASAFGLEFLDAYTIRKALPRVLVAVIFISLSWQILEFLVTLSNDIGIGIRALMYAPFQEHFGTALLRGGEFFAGLLAVGGALMLLKWGILFFVLVAALGLLTAFLTLIVRELIIMVLVILAPIAIAMMILPNTQKVWQMWQSTLISVLIAFPIIAAMIAAGRIFSAVTWNNGDASGIMAAIAFVAYILPYFLLPLAFKWAGGVLAGVHGFLGSASQPMSAGLKKRRQAKVAENMSKMKSGTYFSNRNPMTRRFNAATSRAGLGAENRFGFGRRGKEALDQQRRNTGAELLKSPGGQAIMEDDDALHAATYLADHSQSDAVAKLKEKPGWDEAKAKRAVAAAKAAGFDTRAAAVAAAQQLGATGTGYGDVDDMTETVARAAGGNKSTAASMSGYLNFINKQKGRHDLAPGAGKVIEGVHAKMDGRPAPRTKLQTMQDAWESGSLYQVANGKQKQMENFAAHAQELLRSGDPNNKVRAAVMLKEMQNMLPSASGANQQVINKAMSDAGIYHDESLAPQKTVTIEGPNNTTQTVQRPMTIDEQIIAKTGGYIKESELNGKARVYDREEARLRREAGS